MNGCLGTVVAVALAVAGCSGSSGGDSRREADASSKHGLSPEFKVAAGDLRQFVDEKVAQAKDRDTHATLAEEGRASLQNLRRMVETGADRQVFLLLALMMSKDNQRKELVFQTRDGLDYSLVQEDISGLYEERQYCSDEILGWLELLPTPTSELEAGRCLREAEAAGAVLGF